MAASSLVVDYHYYYFLLPLFFSKYRISISIISFSEFRNFFCSLVFCIFLHNDKWHVKQLLWRHHDRSILYAQQSFVLRDHYRFYTNSVDCWWLIVVCVGSTAMYAHEYANVNAPFHMNYAHFVSYPMNYTMEIHSIKQILMLTALLHKQMAVLVLMVMWFLYIYDIRDYCTTKRIYYKDLHSISLSLLYTVCDNNSLSLLNLLAISFIGWFFSQRYTG